MRFALALVLVLVACGGAVAVDSPPPPSSSAPAPEPADAGCDAATVDEWCRAVARGGLGVDPRADACCSRWLDEALDAGP
jgi:hypothetical protein